MIIRIFNYDYYNILENEYDPDFVGPVLVLCGRDITGKFHRVRCLDNKFRPHFFVEDTKRNRQILITHSLDWEPVDYPAVYNDEERIIKTYVQFPYEVTHYRKLFEHTYNADVKWAQLAMMTLQLPNGFIDISYNPNSDWVKADEIKPVLEKDTFFVEPRVYYFDLETDMIDHEKEFGYDNSMIISLVVYDNYLNRYYTLEWSYKNTGFWMEYKTVKRSIKKNNIVPYESEDHIYHCVSERELLEKFFEIFTNRPDALEGFNSHGGNIMKSYKSETRREWTNGYDELVIYVRAMINGLHKEMQKMSPLPDYKNAFGRYYGVYKRGRDPKFEVVIRGLTPLDVMFDIPKMGYLEKYRDFFGGGLDDYLEYFANIGKVSHVGMSVAEFKEFDLNKELEYNRRDVEGCFFLDKSFGFHNDVFERVGIIQSPGIDLHQSTKIHNFLTLKYSQGKVVYDSKWQDWNRNIWKGWLEEKKDFFGVVTKKKNRAGGYNVEVDRGAHGMTMIMDFSRLYPNLLIAANVGIDTLVSVKEEHDDYFIDFNGKIIPKSDCNITPSAPFLREHIKKAIDTEIWETLITWRDKLKNAMKKLLDTGIDVNSSEYKLVESKEYNLKQGVLNNKFGVMGNRGYIAFCPATYNASPSMAQTLIRSLAEDFLPKHNYHTIAGDTDSVMVRLYSKEIEEAIEESEVLIGKANEHIKHMIKKVYNIETEKAILDWEKIGGFFYIHAKKNYMMEVWAQDGRILPIKQRYIMYKGFQLKKKDRSDVTEMVQKSYFKLAKKIEKENLDYKYEMGEFIKRLEKIFQYLSWEKISSRISIKRKLHRYAVNFMNRRAAEYSNERFGTTFSIGSKGFLGYRKTKIKLSKKPVVMFRKEDIPHIKELGYELDYDWHFQKFVKDKIDYLFEDYGLDWNGLKQKSRISSVLVI